MHVRRAAGGTTQRWRLESSDECRIVPGHKPQLTAIVWQGVAVGPEAIERVGQYLVDRVDPSAIDRQPLGRRHPRVMEKIVGEARAVVAVDAARLADEQLQSFDLERVKGLPGRRVPPADDRFRIAIEAGFLMGDGALER